MAITIEEVLNNFELDEDTITDALRELRRTITKIPNLSRTNPEIELFQKNILNQLSFTYDNLGVFYTYLRLYRDVKRVAFTDIPDIIKPQEVFITTDTKNWLIYLATEISSQCEKYCGVSLADESDVNGRVQFAMVHTDKYEDLSKALAGWELIKTQLGVKVEVINTSAINTNTALVTYTATQGDY